MIKVLFLKTFIHDKNWNALQKYKNIDLTIVHSLEELYKQDLTKYDAVYSPSTNIDVKLYPTTRFIFGPHFSTFAEKERIDIISGENSIYIHPSKWAKNSWNMVSNQISLQVLPWGVDTDFELDPKIERTKVFIYFKSRELDELYYLVDTLQKKNIEFVIFSYQHRYPETEYKKYLEQSKFGIWLDAHESQGFALLEALSYNVPLLVWNVKSMKQEYGRNNPDIPATTIPYWDNRCGEFFYDKSEFVNTFDTFLSKIDTYAPREYILENLTMEICEKKFINIIQNNPNHKNFIIFHKFINESQIFPNFNDDYIKEKYIYYTVNETFYKPKQDYKCKTIKEWELKKYNPFLQKRGYMETSAYLHIYWNLLHNDLDFIGIFQYDMIHTIKYDNLDKNTIYLLHAKDYIVDNGKWNRSMLPHLRDVDFLLKSYNKYYDTKYTVENLNRLPLSLWQCNIYPRMEFIKLCGWLTILVDELYPWSNDLPYETHWGVIGGFTERAIGLFNAIEILEGKNYVCLKVDHVNTEGVIRHQYNKNSFLNFFDRNIHTKYISNITSTANSTYYSPNTMDYAMFKSFCKKGNIMYYCDRISIKGKNGLGFSNSASENVIYKESGIESEDPRMIMVKDKIYVVFQCISPYVNQSRCIAITEYDNYNPIFLRVNNMEIQNIEKNWAPFVKNDELYFVYNYDPLVIIKYDFNTDGCCDIVFIQDNISLPLNTENTQLRGGSNLINCNNTHYIGGCHSRVFFENNYYHFTHIVMLDVKTWKILYLSKPVMYTCMEDGIEKIPDTNIIFRFLPDCIQDPVSIQKLEDNKYYISVNMGDRCTGLTLMYQIEFNIPTDYIGIDHPIGYYNHFVGECIQKII